MKIKKQTNSILIRDSNYNEIEIQIKDLKSFINKAKDGMYLDI